MMLKKRMYLQMQRIAVNILKQYNQDITPRLESDVKWDY